MFFALVDKSFSTAGVALVIVVACKLLLFIHIFQCNIIMFVLRSRIIRESLSQCQNSSSKSAQAGHKHFLTRNATALSQLYIRILGSRTELGDAGAN